MKKFKSAIKVLSPFIRKYKIPFIASIISVILSAVFTALSPKVEGFIITRLTENFKDIIGKVPGAQVDFDYIKRILFVLLVIYVLGALSSYLSSYFLTNAIQNTMRDLRNAIKNKITKLPVRYFDTNTYGNVLSRITNDVDSITNALQQSLIQILIAFLQIGLALIMMFLIDVKLALIGVAIIPLSLLITKLVVNNSQNLFKKQQNALGELNGKVQELYTGFNEIKLYGKEEDVIKDFEKATGELSDAGFMAQFISSTMSPLVGLVTYLSIGVMAVLGGRSAILGIITVGNLQALVRYIWQINQPLSQVTQLSSAIQAAFAAFDRVNEFLNEEEEIDVEETLTKINNPKGNVSFKNVKFGYSEDKVLINNLNLEVKSGQMVAIVGPTGAGKTTIINLLMRFYDVLDGAIEVDGVNIKRMKREDLREIFGMVLQDTWLFNGTIYENLEYGRFGATKADIVEAAKVANVHHFIKTMPDGYDMKLNEEASNISQGEKQLLTIARAVLRDPAILILDEATSSIDTRLEILIQTAMRNIMKGRTSFVIAHRLSTIKNADLILVLKDGSIIEQGNHEELMKQGGFYKDLYNSQFSEKEEA